MSDTSEASLNRMHDRLDILEARMLALELAVAAEMNVVADVPGAPLVFDCGHRQLNTIGQCMACGTQVIPR